MNQRGSGMVLSLVGLVVMAGLAAGIYRLTRVQTRESLFNARMTQARSVAEAGLDEALYQLRLLPAWRAGIPSRPALGGSYLVSLTADPASPWVTSTGYSAPLGGFGKAAYTVKVQARLYRTLRNRGFSGLRAYSISVDGLIDSYDSSVSVSPASFGPQAQVWSNGLVTTLAGGVRIRGNVKHYLLPPPASPTVEGTVSQTTYTVALPFHDGSGFLASNDNNRIEPPGVFDQGSKELVVTPSQTATLYPGNYYFKKLIVSGVLNCRTSTGTVTIYIDGPVQVHSAGLVVNDTARPERLLLYKQASHPNNIQGEAPVHAYLEAPLGDVQVTGTFYGNIVAASLAVRSTATVHFDVQFAEVDKVGWEMASWSARPGD